MTINRVGEMSRSLIHHGTSEKNPDDSAFKTILEQEMDAQPAGDPDHAPPPSAPETIPDITFGPPAIVDGRSIIRQVEDFLGNLEAYQQKLKDAGVSLKEISPLVEQIRAEGEHLSTYLDRLPAADGMQDILSQMLVTSSLEVARFNRGEYVD